MSELAEQLRQLSVLDGSGERWTPVAASTHFLLAAPGRKAVWISGESFRALAAEQPALRAHFITSSATSKDPKP